jgi:two-component system sensor histidine kinase AgrC
VCSSDLSEVGIKISELCEILGILLDNAIEAASESEEKLIRLVVRKIDTSISFSIENSVKEIPDIRKIYEKSYSTKGDGRGMGLWFLNNIIKKNKNIMLNTLTNEKRFKQDLIVS